MSLSISLQVESAFHFPIYRTQSLGCLLWALTNRVPENCPKSISHCHGSKPLATGKRDQQWHVHPFMDAFNNHLMAPSCGWHIIPRYGDLRHPAILNHEPPIFEPRVVDVDPRGWYPRARRSCAHPLDLHFWVQRILSPSHFEVILTYSRISWSPWSRHCWTFSTLVW